MRPVQPEHLGLEGLVHEGLETVGRSGLDVLVFPGRGRGVPGQVEQEFDQGVVAVPAVCSPNRTPRGA